MIKVKVYNQKAEKIDDIQLSDKVFNVKTNLDLVHQAVLSQMGNIRQVLAHTKDRSEVSGGGKKPWRQKGTGRARVGSSRSPIWKGGGVTFGPTKDRNFKKNINRKMKQKALTMVLSGKVKDENFVVLEKFEAGDYKTKIINEMLFNFHKNILKEEKEKLNILVITDKNDEKVKYSMKNIVGVKIINSNNINILDLLKYKNVILTKGVVKLLEEQYGGVKEIKTEDKKVKKDKK
ncbi:50S ribosomal protein L4 [Candidatus Falkowbacteria bacterium RIFOXYB2_FULL_34_18]|uniref:Large ribosomal subunit protein uL4 n=1 Tax=Candidatus Falkowbacteria bacterium RIFOXYD2_FULL_34_120 TaxID=1798007 RepID=A0A1F5TSB5_9BACT|nr:MAG: 50S ribosomal protein L4 [Candidatus Falkowbacteria bacterium RIFOXYB2_FULL_34_18]OGF30067.1 MAG: 50S ribosomal protein L4 [Candidatus Falkowbacteria bacterium RIFOXYC12_FULL_34_55]OGF37600.1 MAG: 50S ribosomal protein L4 [Candidatus Falkowbacteria bacterium RIFOXYC2_FULL_34_220]OGF39355.1 MAG: 50S ribosomal protein L4 [Candidatus Falkowbacteria bacterium RIFOXYD12_FULL_34_57]OGF41860.1 MAG: 50S ribosomal protein L4 [Candidatus Falkowbacteria bacterium RIFOXYD2_FULL_34_120]